MFADALDTARQFTRPVIQSIRFFDGSIESGPAACVFINRDGWFVTAAHVLNAVMAAQNHAAEIQRYEAAVAQITSNPKLNSKGRHKQIRQLRANQKWITNQSTVIGVGPGLAEVADWRASLDIDLAAGRVQPFDPSWVPVYAVFKNPSQMRQGTSLCRLGYPFVPLACTYDAGINKFNVTCGGFPTFPNEGIYTRELLGPMSANGPFGIRFIETSSAGLRGQSGGPVVDARGVVWGIQSKTEHRDLGFNPDLKLLDGKQVTVHQFMNVGLAVHPKTIHEFLTAEGINFEVEQ